MRDVNIDFAVRPLVKKSVASQALQFFNSLHLENEGITRSKKSSSIDRSSQDVSNDAPIFVSGAVVVGAIRKFYGYSMSAR